MPSKEKAPSTQSRVKKLRRALGLSQRDLAKELRVSASAVAHWESGEREVSGPVSKLLELYESGLSAVAHPIKLAMGDRNVS